MIRKLFSDISTRSGPRASIISAVAGAIVSTLAAGVISPAAHAQYAVDQILTSPFFDESDIDRLLNGGFAVAKLHEVSDRELAVTIACLVDLAPEEALGPFLGDSLPVDEEHLVAQLLIDTDDPEASFESITLSNNARKEIERYLRAEPGLGLNLSEDELSRLNDLRGSGGPAQVEDFVEDALLGRYRAYRQAGLAGAKPYARENGEFVMPGEELRISEQRMTGLYELFPEFHDAWLGYPAMQPEGITHDDYFWVELEVEDRPTFLLSHRLASVSDEKHVIGIRDYYPSHFFDVAQRTVAVADIESGERVLVYQERAWVDFWSGFAKVKRRMGRKVLTSQMEHLLSDRGICGT